MENQHRKITGYRELNQEEINLMNRIKEAGADLLNLHAELQARLEAEEIRKAAAVEQGDADADNEYVRFLRAEPLRWASIGKTDIQTGIMALVRAIAQPGGGV